MTVTDPGTDQTEQIILRLLAEAGAGSISPVEAARALAGNPADDSWRRCLAPIRLAAIRLARSGRIDILRKGKPVAPADARGVIRFRMPRAAAGILPPIEAAH